MNISLAKLLRPRSPASEDAGRSVARSRSVKALFWGAVLATITSVAVASPASAQLVRIQQVSTGRHLDAWESNTYDFQAVVWSQQDNDSQLWRMIRVDGDVYRLQQVNTGRYLDAYQSDAQDWNAVTRPDQANTTQQWLITDLGGDIHFIQQVSSGRYLDAHENEANGWRVVTRAFQNNASQQWRITIVQYELNPGLLVPIDPGILLPSGAPPPPQPVHSSGAFELAPPLMANVDEGNIAFAGADLHYFAPNLNDLALVPINGAVISYTNGAQRGYAGCSAAAFSNTPVTSSSISAGDYLCVRTNEGRISELQVTGIGAILGVLSISYTTWQ
jgi:hypothetical protein